MYTGLTSQIVNVEKTLDSEKLYNTEKMYPENKIKIHFSSNKRSSAIFRLVLPTCLVFFLRLL